MPEATSASITPDCRAGRGNDGAWDEAVRRLRVEYDAVIEGWRDQPVQPTIRVALIVERPGRGTDA